MALLRLPAKGKVDCFRPKADPGIACRIGPFPENGDRQLQRVLGAMDELLEEEFTMDDFAFQLLDPMREAMRRPVVAPPA